MHCNSTVQIQPPPWLNLRRKPELDSLPLELDFLYGHDSVNKSNDSTIPQGERRVAGERAQQGHPGSPELVLPRRHPLRHVLLHGGL